MQEKYEKNIREIYEKDLDILVMEKCDNDKTNCKYAYLEVFE